MAGPDVGDDRDDDLGAAAFDDGDTAREPSLPRVDVRALDLEGRAPFDFPAATTAPRDCVPSPQLIRAEREPAAAVRSGSVNFVTAPANRFPATVATSIPCVASGIATVAVVVSATE